MSLLLQCVPRPLLARLADAEPVERRRAVDRGPIAAVARPVGKVGLVGEARVLGPDARVDDADDDVLAAVPPPSRPEPPSPASPRSIGGVVGHRLPGLDRA